MKDQVTKRSRSVNLQLHIIILYMYIYIASRYIVYTASMCVCVLSA